MTKSGDGLETRSNDCGCAACGIDDVYELLAGNIAAVVKSTEIWTRGFGTVQRAVVGSGLMVLDDAIAEARSCLTCTTLYSLVQLRVDLLRVSLSRLAGCGRLIARTLSDLVEEALFPLERRLAIILERWDQTAPDVTHMRGDSAPA